MYRRLKEKNYKRRGKKENKLFLTCIFNLVSMYIANNFWELSGNTE